MQKLSEGLSVGTVKELVLVLRMVLRHGAEMGLCEKPDWTIHYPCPLRQKCVTVLSNPHCRRILEAVLEHPTAKNIGIHISLLTGLRIGEICALRWGDIDLSSGVLHVRRTLSRVYVSDALRPFCKLLLDRPKTDSSVRDIPLEDGLRRSLEAFRWSGDPECYVLSGSNRPIEPRSYRNYFASFLDSLEIPRVEVPARKAEPVKESAKIIAVRPRLGGFYISGKKEKLSLLMPLIPQQRLEIVRKRHFAVRTGSFGAPNDQTAAPLAVDAREGFAHTHGARLQVEILPLKGAEFAYVQAGSKG